MFDDIDPLIFEKIQLYAVEVGISLIKVLVIFVVGRIAIFYFLKLVSGAFERWKIEPSLRGFLKSIVRFVLYTSLILIIAQSLHLKVAALFGVLGAAGLAVGLALQGSLSNFAGGILILIFKPFRIDDIIEAQGFLGQVEKIDILHTHVCTFDNKLVIMPNGALANSNVTNLTAKDKRRVEMSIGVAYGTDVARVREIATGVLTRDERILSDPEPVLKFTGFGDSALNLSVRCWTTPDEVWPVYWDNMEALNNAFAAEGIEIPFPQRTIHMRPQ